jgi:hypothetical protein
VKLSILSQIKLYWKSPFTFFESEEERLLGIKIDNKLKFKTHITDICKKAGSKLTAIARQCNLLSLMA